ncbi:hypothetical protein SEUCBS139899_000467 [Sporothrix eucalyptigena]|uniref:Uncharacterized protein n=1 Tax=Sporothrix eucalyptigena TaxID=1812306 RepID=A0ABP0BBZ3_9PEZI
MPRQTPPAATNSPTNSSIDMPNNADPENEEYDEQRFKNRERAYVAASRRTDRTIEARIVSAQMASRYHLRLYGRALRINEEVVRGDGIYEEIEDAEDKKRRLQLGDLTEEEQRTLASAPPGTEQYNIAQKLKREADVNREFEQLYSGVYAQMQMRNRQQQQQAAMMPHGQIPPDAFQPGQLQQVPVPPLVPPAQTMQQLQWQQQQEQQAFHMQQQQYQQPQFVSGPPQMFSSPQNQHATVVPSAGVYQQHPPAGPATMSPQSQYSNGVDNNGVSPQPMMAGVEPGLGNTARFSARSNSTPNGAEMASSLSSGSNASGAPSATVPILHRDLARHSFSSPHTNGVYPANMPALSSSVHTPGSTPSVSTPTSQEGTTYVVSPHGNFQMQSPMGSQVPRAVRQNSSSSGGIMMPAYQELAPTMDTAKLVGQTPWHNQGAALPYTVPQTGKEMPPVSSAQAVSAMPWATTYPAQDPILSTVGQGYPPTTATIDFNNGFLYQGQQHLPTTMANMAPDIPSTLSSALPAAGPHAVPMAQQLSSRIGTPGGSAGDQWTDWVQFNNDGN